MIVFNGYLIDPWDWLYFGACLLQAAIIFPLVIAWQNR